MTGVPRRARRFLLAVAVLALAGCDGHYLITRHHHDGTPVTWRPCQTIEYRINPDGFGANRQAVVHDAMAAASTASGIPVHYDGPTTRPPGEPGPGPVYVYAAPFEGPAADHDAYSENSVGDGGYYNGAVIIVNTDAALTWRRLVYVVWHQVGHVFGLDHPGWMGEVMQDAAPPYREGDRAGLAAVGRQPGEC